MPFDNSSLNRIGSNLIDYNLRVHSQADIGKSVLIIGTSADGPVNVPVRVTELGGLASAEDVFGSVSTGSLMHTAYEVVNANRRAKDTRLMRISNGNLAQLCFSEVPISGEWQWSVNEESYWWNDTPVSQIDDVLCLIARYPGQIYNSISVRTETGDGVEHLGSQYVVIYNPKTGVESWFSYNYLNYAADVDCYTTQDLADAINADPNLNGVIVAQVRELRAIFELDVSDPNDPNNTLCDRGISYDANGYLRITLSQITPLFYSDPGNTCMGNVTVTGGAYNVPTVGNLINLINEIYAVLEYTEEEVNLEGLSSIQLTHIPVKGVSTIPTSTIITYRNGSYMEYATPQIVLHYAGVVVGNIVDTGTLAYEFSSDICPDDGYTATYYCDGTDTMYMTNIGNVGTQRSNVQLDSLFSTFHLYGTKNNIRYEVPSGQYACSFDYGNETVTVTFCSGNYIPSVGTVLSCEYDSVIEDLTVEAGTLTACLNSADWHQYFVSGKTLTFGTALPADASFRYRYKKVYEEGADFVVSSSTGQRNDMIVFTSLDDQPDLSGAMDVSGILMGFDYIYGPQWINLTGTQTLGGGTNGVSFTNYEKHELLDTAFKAIGDYPVSYVVLADTYLDDTKTIYDPELGVPTVVNAGFHTLFHNYLEGLTGATSETIGIMSVKPADGTTPTQIADWIAKIWVVDSNDPTRAANILSSFGSKYMAIVAGELVFSNEAANVPYTNTAEGVYGGLLSTLPVNTAPSNKGVYGVTNVRYQLSGGENGQLDKLTQARLVTFRQKQDGSIAVVSGVTVAPDGSDYAREMTRNTTFECMGMVRLVCDPFLGEGNSPQIRAAMETAINSGLQRFVEMNPPALQAYDFTIRSTAEDQVNGIVYIDLVLVPVFELREIRVTVKLRAEL